MNKISATIITHNEETNIGACLDSLQGIADEIIVVDSYSTDRTIEICKQKGCKIYQKEFNGFGVQRQYATSLTTHDYIISIDADEIISPALRKSLFTLKSEGFRHRVYAFSRLNFYCGVPIRHCAWYPNWQIRLFDKHYASWNLHDVGERVIFPDSLTEHHIAGDLLHYRCSTPEEYLKKQHQQAVIAGHGLAANRRNTTRIAGFFKAISSFLQCYIVDKGILDGPEGYAISHEHYTSTLLSYSTARNIKKSARKNKKSE